MKKYWVPKYHIEELEYGEVFLSSQDPKTMLEDADYMSLRDGDCMVLVEESQLAEAVETLKQIDAEWCKHPNIRLADKPEMHRDWCEGCAGWVYRNEKNPAREFLEKHGSNIASPKNNTEEKCP